jgi:glycosyltransferase involved in cell wall biosynthesis
MKILYALFQSQNRSNGGLISMTHILKNIDHLAEPVIMTNTRGPFNQQWENYGWEVHNIHLTMTSMRRHPLRKLHELWRSNYTAYHLLKNLDDHILYCNDPQGFWYAGIGGRLAGAHLLFNLRDTLAESEYKRSLWKWRLMGRWAEHIIVLSREMKEFVEKYMLRGRPAPKVHPVYSIVDMEHFHPVDNAGRMRLRDQLGLPRDKKIILYVGAFNEKKAQPPFIKNVLSRFSVNDPVHFCFLGDYHPETNPIAAACRRLVGERGLAPLVSFCGFVDNIADYYKTADVVALASQKEGLARCMIEGLACGTPVISFDVCSTREILEDHRCGIVITQGDYPAFTASLKDLLAAGSQRQQMGRRGADTIKALFSKQQVVDAYSHILASVAGEPEYQEGRNGKDWPPMNPQKTS